MLVLSGFSHIQFFATPWAAAHQALLSMGFSRQEYWRRQWHPTPVLLPGKSHGWRSLVGCSPWGRWGSDMTERLHVHFSLSCIGEGNGNPLQCSCLENPRDGGAWWAAVYGSHRVRHNWSDLAAAAAAGKNIGVGCPPSSEDLLHPGIEPTSPASPALQVDSLPLSHWGYIVYICVYTHLATGLYTHLTTVLKIYWKIYLERKWIKMFTISVSGLKIMYYYFCSL